MPTEQIIVRGVVQGVGFRPFVWRLAQRFAVSGEVSNHGDAVVILACGPQATLDALAEALVRQPPPLAQVDSVTRSPAAPYSGVGFAIAASAPGAVSVGVVPDIATCPACLAEMRHPAARRADYAFTNCTDCGPRFSIVEGLPYDRASTTMRGFIMCPDCRVEYDNPADRRFHAQPIACPACGPRLMLDDGGQSDGDPVSVAARLLRAGRILAIKGIGGFHIACDGTNEGSVAELRARKRRPAKPLAVMVRDRAMLESLCHVATHEWVALAHPSAPIVLLRMRDGAALAPSVAPGQNRLGVMLPYTPLHHRLMEAVEHPLVLTSGNRSSEPQIFRDAEAVAGLAGIVDGFLTHDRSIARRLDDSVVQCVAGRVQVVRRGRGLAPAARDLPAGFAQAPPVLALGGDLKSAVCLTLAGKALLSHHLGDLEEPTTQDEFDRALADHAALFAHQPAAIAIDLHPGYRPSRIGTEMAAARGLPLIAIQHHHAHIAATMAERGWPLDGGRVIGVALDGLGLGEDGTIWGAEILLCDYRSSRRLAGLKPIPLAGGDAANREPWRVLLAHLDAALRPGEAPGDLFEGRPVPTLRAMIARGINAPLASSAGRLFDAMAALLGLAPARLGFEGQAAMALQVAAEAVPGGQAPYPFATQMRDGLVVIDPAPMWRAALADRAAGMDATLIARRFHEGVAAVFVNLAVSLAAEHGVRAVALSGGVFQNALLLETVATGLARGGVEVLLPEQVPANDGGLAFGQATIAAARLLPA